MPAEQPTPEFVARIAGWRLTPPMLALGALALYFIETTLSL